MIKKNASLIIVMIIMLGATVLIPSGAQAESVLQILPTRLVMTNERSATLTLINRGDEAADYRLFFRNIRTTESGDFVTIEEAGEGDLFSDKMIRYSPRQVNVPAQSKQTVRVVVRKPKGLSDGEYRSHLVFRKLRTQTPILQDNDTSTMATSLKPDVEVTIAVIVRQGDLNAKVALSDVEFHSDAKSSTLSVRIDRTGNRSLYGTVEFWRQQENGEETRIAAASGVAVYSPNAYRIITVRTDIKPEEIAANGKIRVSFVENPDYGGDSVTELTTNVQLMEYASR